MPGHTFLSLSLSAGGGEEERSVSWNTFLLLCELSLLYRRLSRADMSCIPAWQTDLVIQKQEEVTPPTLPFPLNLRVHL